jgi:hypothetical protein
MNEPRDDVPLADLDEQQRDLVSEQEPEEGDDLPDLAPDTSGTEANEADVLEQSLPVNETEDYPHGPEEEE